MVSDARLSDLGGSVNERILSALIRHGVYLERFKAGEARKILSLLSQGLIPDAADKLRIRLSRINLRGYDSGVVTTARYKDMIAAVNAIIDENFGSVLGELKGDLVDLSKYEAKFNTDLLDRVVGRFGVDFSSPDIPTLRAVVTATPFEGKLLSEWVEDLSVATQKRMQQQLSIGLAQGETVDDLVRRFESIEGVNGATRRGTEALIRTAVTSVSSHAREQTFAENDDVIERVQFVATLDTRTTFICRSLDGKTFPIGEGPRPPLHINCRSTIVPIVISASKAGLKLDQIPGARASMNGAVPDTLTYEDWLRDQDASTQVEALGRGRYKLWKAGKLSLADMVDSSGRPLTLEEIAERGA